MNQHRGEDTEVRLVPDDGHVALVGFKDRRDRRRIVVGAEPGGRHDRGRQLQALRQ